ncbi:Histidine--tRNA ligase [Candidatus Hepatincola sp. Av]
MKYQNVRGTHDLLGEELQKFQYIEKLIYEIAKLYGFQEIRTPILEFAEIFEKNVGESTDIVNKEMYIFQGKNEERIALRPEGTAPVVRALISNSLTHSLPLKFFYIGSMFRYERPQKGRQRQFNQVGFEYLGTNHYTSDVEMILLAIDFIKKLGITDYQLQINTLGSNTSLNAYKKELVTYLHSVENKLSADSQTRLQKNPLRILDSKNEQDQQLLQQAPKISGSLTLEDKELFTKVLESLKILNIPYVINEKLVRGLDYYSHSVFEVVTNTLGAQGTLIAGGRYNDMIKEMSGPNLGAFGFAAGLERLALMLQPINLAPESVAIITKEDEFNNYALQLANTLRHNNIASQYILGKDIKVKLKRTSPKIFKIAIIIGENEYNTKILTVKNLQNGQSTKVEETKLQSFLQNS